MSTDTKEAVYFTIGAVAGVLLGGFVGFLLGIHEGWPAGIQHGQCMEACAPDLLVESRTDGACRCSGDRIVRGSGSRAAP